MELLPIELKFLIFDHLNLPDLLRLRLLSKEYATMLRTYPVRELILQAETTWRENWFFDDRPINCDQIISSSKLTLLTGAWPAFDFSGLQRLKIGCLIDDDAVSLKNLNQLRQLQHLEIFLNECVQTKNRTLSLPNLKTLALQLRNVPELKIVAPKLEHLFHDCSLKNLDIKHSLSIRFLVRLGHHDSDIERFQNLEHYRITYGSGLDVSLLSALSKLKTLSIDLEHGEDVSILNELLKEKKKLRRHALRIYYKEVELTKFVFRLNFEKSELDWQIRNYPLLAPRIRSTSILDYTALMNTTRKLPEDFFDRFVNIQAVRVNNRVRDRNHFLNFIQNCRNLSCLSLELSELDQATYDRLPDVCSVFELKILDPTYDLALDGLKLDYNFLSRMTELRCFETRQQLKVDTIWMLAKMKSIRTFSGLLSLYVEVRIDKLADDRFNCTNPHKKKHFRESVSLLEMVEWTGFLRNACTASSDLENSAYSNEEDDEY